MTEPTLPRKLTINGKEVTPQNEADEYAKMLDMEVILRDQFGNEVACSSRKKDGAQNGA